MARQLEEMAYYAVRDDRGLPRVCHSVKSAPPDDGIEISEAEARQISKAYRVDRPAEAKADTEGFAVAVLNEAREQIVAVVNEASGDRDQKFVELANRVKAIEVVIDALDGAARKLEGKR